MFVDVLKSFTCLIPSLDSSGNGIQDDGKVERFGVAPSVGNFVPQGHSVTFLQFGNVIDTERVLCDQCTLLQHGQDIRQAMGLRIVLHIYEEVCLGNSDQRILDPLRL